MGIEYKNRVGGEPLGVVHAAKERRLGSPYDGVPIKKIKKESRNIIRNIERLIGLSSWIDNI